MKRINDVYFADFETTEFKTNIDYESIDVVDFKLFCAVKLNSDYTQLESEKVFWSLSETIDFFLSEPNKKKIIYFHNLSFDSKVFLQELYNMDKYIISFIRSGSRILQITIQKNTQKRQIICEFRDSLAILLKSIAVLGKLVNLDKLEFDFDYETNPEIAIDYCITDCKIIYYSLKYIIEFVKTYYNIPLLINKLPLTIGSIAKKCISSIYPEAFQKHQSYIERFLRPFYFGGRTEVFDFKKEKSICFDVNSEYPFAMSTFDYANGKVLRSNAMNKDISIESFMNNPNALGIEAIINERDINLPYFPSRTIVEGKEPKVIFGLGIKKAFITKQDIYYLKKEGLLHKNIQILEINAIYLCLSITNFSKFVIPTYNLRKTFNSEHVFNYISKIFLNSCYGKFGQRIKREKLQLIPDLSSIDTDKVDVYLSEYTNDNSKDVMYSKRKYNQTYQTDNLINAVLTTSYGRMTLYSYLRIFEQKGYRIKYTDTDSLFVNCIPENYEFEQSFKDNTELGGLKIEYECLNFQPIDAKEYHFLKETEFDIIPEQFVLILNKFELKHKGISIKNINSSQQLLDHYTTGSYNTIIPTIFYCINRHSSFNSTFTLLKQKKSYYHKRAILPDLSTEPINLQNPMSNLKDNIKYVKDCINKMTEIL